MKQLFYLSIACCLSLLSCTKKEVVTQQNDKLLSFNRKAVLSTWTNEFIIPYYSNFVLTLNNLETKTLGFLTTPTLIGLDSLKNAFDQAYLSYQKVAMFELGKALDLDYRSNMNSYPTDTTKIKQTVIASEYDLNQPDLKSAQGFPAIDFLLYGKSERQTLSLFNSDSEADKYGKYLKTLVSRMKMLSNTVLDDWKYNYRQLFIENTDVSRLGSISKLTNAYMLYYEKFLRAGKLGIPAGVFTGNSLPDRSEAYYHGKLSLKLLKQAIQTTQIFFNGISEQEPSFKQYIDFLEVKDSKGTLLSKEINTNFDLAIQKINQLFQNDVANQVREDNIKILEIYDILQRNVILMKIDMVQALSITVAYVDADGD